MNNILKILVMLAIISTGAFAQPPQTPQPTLPRNNEYGVAPNNINFEWNLSEGALYYHIQIARNINFSGLLDAEQKVIAGNKYTFTASIVNNPPEANADYFWRVAAVNDYGESNWSATQKFRTGFPDGQSIVMHFFNADTSLAMVALNSRDYFDARFLYSKVKTLRRDTTALYRQEDFPYLYIEPFVVRRIDFLRSGGSGVCGHLQFDYRFSDTPPFSSRTDMLVYFHNGRAIPKSRYPKWSYYAEKELPVTALIPPNGKIQSIDSSKTPVLLIHGAGYTSWGNTPAELSAAGCDVWQWLYPAEAPIDSSAALLADAMERLASFYGLKRIGLVGHGSGGLVARSCIQNFNKNSNIGKLLMLGTPNHGSYFAYKLAYTDEFIATAGEYARRLDRNAPLWKDASPGSYALTRLNATSPPPLSASGYDPASSYLCVAGLNDMPLGWPHNEIAGFDDGITSMESVSLLDKNLPLATVMMTAIPGSGNNLLENSGIIISEFLKDNYTPRSPSQQLLAAVGSFTAQPGYVVKPDNYLYDSPGIEIWKIPALTSPRLSVLRDNSVPNITLFPEGDDLSTEARYGMLRNPETGSYFSVNRAGEGGLDWGFINQNHAVRFADYISYPVDRQAATRRRRAAPISVEPLAIRVTPMQTAERAVKFKHQITGAWLTGADRRHEMFIFPETEKTSIRDTIPFRIDPYMDTILVIATPLDNAVPLNSAAAASFNLVAPNGMSFEAAKGNDSTVPQYLAGGAERFAADGIAYFFMARPMAGIWKVACNTAAQPLRFTASFLSDLSLRIITDDSVFSIGDSARFAVVLPNFFFNDLKVSATLYYEANPDSSSLGVSLDLIRDQGNPAIYRGVFVPKSNGIYYIKADFSAQFPESRISRSTFRSVEVADGLPDRPILIFPPRLMKEMPRNTYLAWKRDARARSYRAQVARDFRFDALIADNPYVADTMLILAELEPATTYYWRIQAKNARGTTEWSEVFWFSTGGKALGATSLIVPQNGATVINTAAVFQWEKVAGASLYQFQITKDSLFYASSLDTLIFGTQARFSLENSVKYYWRARALTGTGEIGPWSDTWRVRRLVPAPELSLPVNKSEGLPVDLTFSWIPPAAGLTYRLQISYRPDFQPVFLDERDIQDSVFTTKLPKAGEIYYWRVQWQLSDGPGVWSEIRSFATIVPTPRQDSPGNGVTGVNLNPTISWNSVQNTIYYHLQLSKEPDFVKPVYNDSTTPAVSRIVKQLDPLTRYFWRVRAIAVAGKSLWSEIWEFVTGENPSGVESELSGVKLNVIPNPSSENCRIQLPDGFIRQTGTKIRVELADALGVIVRRQYLDISSPIEAIQLQTFDLPSGAYRLLVYNGGSMLAANLIIAR